MKKKTRTITFNEASYKYAIRDIGVWPGDIQIRIWPEDRHHGKPLNCHVSPFVSITPSAIRELIEWAINAGWSARHDAESIELDWRENSPVPGLARRC